MKIIKHYSKVQRVSFDFDVQDIKDALECYLHAKNMNYPHARVVFEIADMNTVMDDVKQEYHAFLTYILEEEEKQNNEQLLG